MTQKINTITESTDSLTFSKNKMHIVILGT